MFVPAVAHSGKSGLFAETQQGPKVTPLFSIFHRRQPPPEVSTESESAERSAVALSAVRSGSDLEQPLAVMLARLKEHLPPAQPALPANRVSVVSLTERTVGIGNWRGTERPAGFAEVALKGLRLDSVVRFQLWGSSLEMAEDAIDQLHQELLAATADLQRQGFLRLEAVATSTAEYVTPLSAWEQHADYRILYEYHYRDTDGAESLIARIPVHSDLEQRGSAERETTRVTDHLVRWDEVAAPPLVVTAATRRPVRVFGLAALTSLPAGWDGSPVTLGRLRGDASAPPSDYPTLEEFLAAVTRENEPDRHARFVFPSLAAFLAAFTEAGDEVALGDWNEDGIADDYRPARLTFTRPVTLASSDDFLQLQYADPRIESKAVLYLRIALTP